MRALSSTFFVTRNYNYRVQIVFEPVVTVDVIILLVQKCVAIPPDGAGHVVARTVTDLLEDFSL